MTGTPPAPSARREWAAAWPLPFAALAGISGGSLFHFSAGVMTTEITADLDWTRAQFASGFTVMMLMGLVMAPIVGRLVARFGPRRVVLVGIAAFICGFSALGLASGNIWQWRLLCAIFAVTAICASPAPWIAAVAGRFDASRGLAIATALAGLGVAASLWPILAALYLGPLGWRWTFAALVLSWAALVWPLAVFFLRDPPRVAMVESRRVPLSVALRSRTFVCLLAAGSLFAGVMLGVNLNLVPMLQAGGFDRTTAAGIASVAGVLTLGGRVATGYVLDHVAARWVGLVIFALPAVAGALLLTNGGSFAAALSAAILFGLASGGEIDLVTYIASRHLPRDLFAGAYATILAIFAAVASVGPLLAGYLFDRTGAYAAYLWVVIPAGLAGAAIIWLIPPDRRAEEGI